MKPSDIKQVADALSRTVLTVKSERVPQLGEAAKFTTKFKDRNGEPFVFFAYRRPRSKKIYLTDAMAILKTLQKSGLDVQMNLLQTLTRSYGLILTQEGAVV